MNDTAPQSFPQPVAGTVVPRFGDVATFMRLPLVRNPAELEIGMGLRVSDLVAPSGSTILANPEDSVVAVQQPQMAVELEEEAAEGEEGAEAAEGEEGAEGEAPAEGGGEAESSDESSEG